MIKRVLTLTLSVAMILTIFTACGNKEAAESETAPVSETQKETAETTSDDLLTLEFFQQKGEEGPQNGYQEVIARFHEENPNIRIEMNTVPDAPKVLTSRISSGEMPPIFSDYPTQMQFKKKVENGFVQEITGQEFLNRVNPSALEMSKAPDGGIYALPYSNNFIAIYYNIDIFNEQGLEIPETYDELLATCEALKKAGIAPLGLTYKDPGLLGHMFQGMTVTWTEKGVESIEEAAKGNGKMAENAEMRKMAERMLELTNYANEDAFGIANTAMWENFANGKYAMCITGSYARGTLKIANPDINMGVFAIPNDTKESTKVLTGVDAAICLSASASEEEKEAGLAFLEFLSRKENAQVWCDNDGAPSCITEVMYKDPGVQPVIELIQKGQVHDWMASTIDNNIITDLYSVTQGFLLDRDVDAYLAEMDRSIETNANA